MNADLRKQEQRRRDQDRVDRFVVRARRIAAHSLAQDPQQLHKFSLGQIHLNFTATGVTIRYDNPPEEQFESAAARVRPLLLENDVSMLAVLKSVRSLTSEVDEHEEIKRWEAWVRKRWQARIGNAPMDGGYSSEYWNAEEHAATDHLQLALAWIYGDVVHHDRDRLESTKHWGVDERYRAAIPLIAYIMLDTMRVLSSIKVMHERGVLTISKTALTVQVTADPEYHQNAEVSVAPAGTEMPGDLSRQLGSEWQKLDLANAPGILLGADAKPWASDAGSAAEQPESLVAGEPGQPRRDAGEDPDVPAIQADLDKLAARRGESDQPRHDDVGEETQDPGGESPA